MFIFVFLYFNNPIITQPIKGLRFLTAVTFLDFILSIQHTSPISMTHFLSIFSK